MLFMWLAITIALASQFIKVMYL